LYPALGYLPSDSRYDAIFSICAEKNIPILTHCGGEAVSTFEKRIEVNDAGKSMTITGKTRQFRAYQLNDPKYWESVLKKNPKLRVNLAHFGGEDAWLNTNKPSDSQGRLETIIQLMSNYPNVYADFSFNQENRKMQSAFLSAISKKTETAKLIRKRSMYGTDFWVVLNKRNFNDDQRAFIDAIGDFKDDFLCNNVLKYLGLTNEDSIIA
jgi:predicted TIM-barrel fold metal-dependent hydrolase